MDTKEVYYWLDDEDDEASAVRLELSFCYSYSSQLLMSLVAQSICQHIYNNGGKEWMTESYYDFPIYCRTHSGEKFVFTYTTDFNPKFSVRILSE